VYETSRLAGIRSPDRPARSQSLYRLSYRAHNKLTYLTNFYVKFRSLLAEDSVKSHEAGQPGSAV
jgi:hypothetical protein